MSDVALPRTIHTAQPSSTDPDTTFPRLKVKVAPRVYLPADIAPEKPKPKSLEETIKVVAPLGAKITLSWSINASTLEETYTLPESDRHALEDCVGSWMLANLESLGIADAEWTRDSNGDRSATSLALSPVSASPARSPLTTHLVPSTEPTASLVRVELAFWWATSQPKGKRKLDDVEADDGEAGPHSDGKGSGIAAFRGSTQRVGSSSDHSSLKISALEQIAALMPEIIRRSMIRRFPYVFDGSFLSYREHLEVPPALLTAVRNFAFVSARHRPEFLSRCGTLVTKLEESRRRSVEKQIKAVALLPARKQRAKRPKVDSQSSESQSQEPSQDTRQRDEEDASYARAAVAITTVRNEDSNLLARQRLQRLLSEKVAVVGTIKWLETRRKAGKMGAMKAAVDSPDVDYSQAPLAEWPEDNGPLPGDSHLAPPLSSRSPASPRRSLLFAPRHDHSDLPRLPWDDDDDDFSDEDDCFGELEDDYFDDLENDEFGFGYDNYDEELETPPLSPRFYPRTVTLDQTWRGSSPSHTQLHAHFNSLHLLDVPDPQWAHHRVLHTYDDAEDSDEELEDDMVDDDDVAEPADHSCSSPYPMGVKDAGQLGTAAYFSGVQPAPGTTELQDVRMGDRDLEDEPEDDFDDDETMVEDSLRRTLHLHGPFYPLSTASSFETGPTSRASAPAIGCSPIPYRDVASAESDDELESALGDILDLASRLGDFGELDRPSEEMVLSDTSTVGNNDYDTSEAADDWTMGIYTPLHEVVRTWSKPMDIETDLNAFSHRSGSWYAAKSSGPFEPGDAQDEPMPHGEPTVDSGEGEDMLLDEALFEPEHPERPIIYHHLDDLDDDLDSEDGYSGYGAHHSLLQSDDGNDRAQLGEYDLPLHSNHATSPHDYEIADDEDDLIDELYDADLDDELYNDDLDGAPPPQSVLNSYPLDIYRDAGDDDLDLGEEEYSQMHYPLPPQRAPHAVSYYLSSAQHNDLDDLD